MGMGLTMSLAAQPIRLARIATGIAGTTDMPAANDGSRRLFFVQQKGNQSTISRRPAELTAFLDVTSKLTPKEACHSQRY